MPRVKRILSESKIYHVMSRGNEKKNIFLDDEDRQKFLSILLKYLSKIDYKIFSFCLMDNHFHLLIYEGEEGISSIMRFINTSYAEYFNHKYKRGGHLLQDRFKSEPVEGDAHLLAAVRYIHNNPVKAGMVKHPGMYAWSSYRAYFEEESSSKKLVDYRYILNMYSSSLIEARKAFLAFSSQEANETFLDIDDVTSFEEQKAAAMVDRLLKERGLSKESLKFRANIKTRDDLIAMLRNKTKLSVRRIAEILDINKNTVSRVKKVVH